MKTNNNNNTDFVLIPMSGNKVLMQQKVENEKTDEISETILESLLGLVFGHGILHLLKMSYDYSKSQETGIRFILDNSFNLNVTDSLKPDLAMYKFTPLYKRYGRAIP